MQDSPLISVIVPIYKVEPYLRRCLDSIVNQTYTNLEIILVDDGSPDGCPIICDEYAAKDNRIVVIHKENGGLSDARNAGLSICKGEFVYFIDSDDWIENKAIETLYNLLIANGADIVIGNYAAAKETGVCNSQSQSFHNENLTLFALLKCHQPGNPLFTQVVAAWNKLVKREIAQKWPFPKGTICEDHYTLYKYYYSAQKVILSKEITYYYRTRENSIVSNLAKKPIQDKLIQHDYLEKRITFFLNANRPDIAALFAEYYTRNALFLYIKKQEHVIGELTIRDYNHLIKSHLTLKFFKKNPFFLLILYKIFDKLFPSYILTNIIYGKKSGIVGYFWKLLHLPNTNIRKKYFTNN